MITKSFFGKLQNGKEINSYTLENTNGLKIVVLNYGAILKELILPDKNGRFENCVIGYNNLESYESNDAYLGAIIGRVAGRIDNGSFEIDGRMFKTTKNEGGNTLHGGIEGFHKKLADVRKIENNEFQKIKLSFKSSDGEEGFPGNLLVEVSYILYLKEDVLKIKILAKTDKKTYLNPTTHSYFNLTGNCKSDISSHNLKINSDYYAPLDRDMICRSRFVKVDDTAFDFRKGKKISDALESKDEQILLASGVDHAFDLNNSDKKVKNVLTFWESQSGRMMEMFTDSTHMVFYTGNFLQNANKSIEDKILNYQGVCFEAQEIPNAPNVNKAYNFFGPDIDFEQNIEYRFSCK